MTEDEAHELVTEYQNTPEPKTCPQCCTWVKLVVKCQMCGRGLTTDEDGTLPPWHRTVDNQHGDEGWDD